VVPGGPAGGAGARAGAPHVREHVGQERKWRFLHASAQSSVSAMSVLRTMGLPVPTGNTVRLRYEPVRLMLSIGLGRWYINTSITTIDIIHGPVFYIKHDFSET
jgi:hypothetical protein